MKHQLLAALVFLASAMGAPGGASKNLGRTDTEWKGIAFVVTDIARVDDSHILVQLRVDADANTVYPTLIGLPPPAGFLPKNPTLEQLLDDKYRPKPMSFVSSHLLDEKSGTEYPAVTALPPTPYWGPNSILTNLGPTTWVQVAVQFNAPPPPPPGPDGKIELQKASLIFPKSKSPIKGVVLPRNAGP